MDIKVLEQIAANINAKESFQIVVSDNKTRVKTYFNPHIQFKENRRYEIALVNSFPNIGESCNHFKYPSDAGMTWRDIRIRTGCYEITDINKKRYSRET